MQRSDDRIDPVALMRALKVVVDQAPRAEFIVRRYRKMNMGARSDTVVLRELTALEEASSRLRNIAARAHELVREPAVWDVLSAECRRLDAETGEDKRQHLRDVNQDTPPAA